MPCARASIALNPPYTLPCVAPRDTFVMPQYGFLLQAFDSFTALLYMGIMRILAKSVACTGYFDGGGEREYLTAQALRNPPRHVACFEGWHRMEAFCAIVGLLCLYPSAMLTRPLFWSP